MGTVEVPVSLVEMFFRRVRRRERFEKLIKLSKSKFIQERIDVEIPMIEESLRELKKYGVDGEKYFNSAKGQADFLEFCCKEDALEWCSERCFCCKKFTYDGKDMSCFGKLEVFSEACQEHIDIGRGFEERSIAAHDMCMDCLNADKAKMCDFIEITCCDKKNMFVDNCEFRKVKE